jgi:hypothetical protein
LQQQKLQRALNKTLEFEKALCLLKLSEKLKTIEALKYIRVKTPYVLCQTTEAHTHAGQHVSLPANK